MNYLTRRAFFKAGAVSAIGLTFLNRLEKHLLALEKEGDMLSFQREIYPFTAIPSICLQCTAGCGILGLVVDDELVGILGNPKYPGNKGGICTRAASVMNLVYDKSRITTPLKRTNSRGHREGFKPVSWDQAVKEITAKLNEYKSGTNIVQIGTDDGYTPSIDILKKLGNFSIINDIQNENLNKEKGHEIFWGHGAGVPDVANSRYILNFGSNPYESHDSYIPFVQRLIEGRVDNKAKLITFDVRLSNTAGRSDEWLPLRPGSDVVVILAMCKIIIDSGLADNSFINNWTNVSVKQLKDHLNVYTPEMAEVESGVKAKDIKRVAVEFASQKPSVAFCGSGVTNTINGANNQVAVLLLNAIVGNIDKKGGYCLPKKYQVMSPKIKSIPDNLNNLIDDKKRSLGIYLSYMSNPVFSDPSGKRIESLLRHVNKIPYYIAIDTHITETSKYADIILPAAVHLESWGLDSRISVDMIPYIGIRQPVIKPIGEARSFADILAHIAHESGIKTIISEKAYIDIHVKKIIGKSNGAFKKLMQNGSYQKPRSKRSYKTYNTIGFKTRSGKLIVRKKAFGSYIPAYNTTDKADIKKGKLYLTTFTKSVYSSINPNSKWLTEINHDNPLWINPETAKKLGIKNDDLIEVQSNNSKIKIKARVTQMVHPEVAAISRDQGHWEYGNFAQAKKAGTDDDTSLIWWSNKNSFHVNRLIEESSDKVSGARGRMNTIVTIKKAG